MDSWISWHTRMDSSKSGMTPEETGQFVLVKSEDDGLTWSEPINITSQIKNPKWRLFFNGPGMGISMKNGTLVFPAQYRDQNGVPHSTIVYSTDHGANWSVRTAQRHIQQKHKWWNFLTAAYVKYA